MTFGAGVKALLDATGRLSAVFRLGQNLDEVEFPYSTFLDPISEVPLLTGDTRTLAGRRLAQVDVWQREESFDPTLVDDLIAALDGQQVSGGIRVRVTDVQQVPDEEDDIVHHSLTVSTARLR